MTAEPVLSPNQIRRRFDDWLNPIVVKELRQAVQSRFVFSAFLALLCFQLIGIGIYLLVNGSNLLGFEAGRQVFLLLYGILLGVGLLFVPLYSAIRLIAERSDTNIDLLFITTIKPRSIMAGKLCAAVALTILIFSACLPFMVFTYFLRGIDLPSIFLIFALGFITVVACAQVAIFVASLPTGRVLKVLMGLGTLIIFALIYAANIGISNELIKMGIGSQLKDPDFLKAGAVVLSMFGFAIGLAFILSVALITPAAANRAISVRIFIASAWVLLGGEAVIRVWLQHDYRVVIVWQLIFNAIFAVALMAAVSERDHLGRRVLRSVPRSMVRRIVAFIFFSGGASGLTWACLGIGSTLAMVWAITKFFPSYSGHADLIASAKWMGAMCLYFFCYALSGALLRRWMFKKIRIEMTWAIGTVLLALGTTIPFLAGYLFFFSEQWLISGYQNWLVGNPFVWTSRFDQTLYLGVAAFWAALVAGLNLNWFLRRVRDFRPPASM